MTLVSGEVLSYVLNILIPRKAFLLQERSLDSSIKVSREWSIISLVVPFVHPGGRAQGVEVLKEEFTRLEIFTLDVHATVVINIVLPAISAKSMVWFHYYTALSVEIRHVLSGLIKVRMTTNLVWFWWGNRGSKGADSGTASDILVEFNCKILGICKSLLLLIPCRNGYPTNEGEVWRVLEGGELISHKSFSKMPYHKLSVLATLGTFMYQKIDLSTKLEK